MPPALGELSKFAKTLARNRVTNGVADAEKSRPRGIWIGDQALAHLGERHRREIDHRLCGKEIEVRHGFVGASHQLIDLVRLALQHRRIALELLALWRR